MNTLTFCCGIEQWFSMEMMSGYSDATNACSATAGSTSRNLILDVSVWPAKSISERVNLKNRRKNMAMYPYNGHNHSFSVNEKKDPT